jgi:hypothetical protein
VLDLVSAAALVAGAVMSFFGLHATEVAAVGSSRLLGHVDSDLGVMLLTGGILLMAAGFVGLAFGSRRSSAGMWR